jgi:S1-C subfamily serine protease
MAPAANPGPADAAGFSLEEMVDGAMPAIVTVETSTGRGSAFFVQHDTLITNVHVVQNDAYVTLRRMDGTTTNARVQNKAPTFDIAVLKVANAAPTQTYLPLGSQNQLKPGQEVIVIGSALGTLQNSVSRGVVSGLRRSGGVTLVQTDAAANPGNSGGPMLDKNGRVVGVTTAGYREAQGVNFAVSVDHVKDILDGRQANLGTTQRGLSDIKPMRPGAADEQSESDRRQEQGTEDFTARIASAALPAGLLQDADHRQLRSRVVCDVRAARRAGRRGRRLCRILQGDAARDAAVQGLYAHLGRERAARQRAARHGARHPPIEAAAIRLGSLLI